MSERQYTLQRFFSPPPVVEDSPFPDTLDVGVLDYPPELIFDHVALPAERFHQTRELRCSELGAERLDDGREELPRVKKGRSKSAKRRGRKRVKRGTRRRGRTRSRHFSARENIPFPSPISSASLLPSNLATPNERCSNALCVTSLFANALVCISSSFKLLARSPPM